MTTITTTIVQNGWLNLDTHTAPESPFCIGMHCSSGQQCFFSFHLGPGRMYRTSRSGGQATSLSVCELSLVASWQELHTIRPEAALFGHGHLPLACSSIIACCLTYPVWLPILIRRPSFTPRPSCSSHLPLHPPFPLLLHVAL